MGERKYKLSDNVLMRIVQIVQEGFLLGIDVVDIMRLIELRDAGDGSDAIGVMDLTYEYIERVKREQQVLLDNAPVPDVERLS